MGRRPTNKKNNKKQKNSNKPQRQKHEPLSQTFRRCNDVLYRAGYLKAGSKYEFFIVSKKWIRQLCQNEKSKQPKILGPVNKDLLANNIYDFDAVNTTKQKNGMVRNNLDLDDDYEVVTNSAWEFLTTFTEAIEIRKTFYIDEDIDLIEINRQLLLNVVLINSKEKSHKVLLTVNRTKKFEDLIENIMDCFGDETEHVECYLYDSRRDFVEFDISLNEGVILGQKIDDWDHFPFPFMKEHDILIIDASSGEFNTEASIGQEEAYCYGCRKERVLSFHCKCDIVSYCSIECKYSDFIIHKDLCKKELDYRNDMKTDLKVLDKENKNDGVIGLENIGNSCYLNSLIQLIKYNPCVELSLINKESNAIEEPSLLEASFFQFFSQLWFSKKPIVTPWFLKIALGLLKEDYLYFDQNDAHECLMNLIDGLNDSNLSCFKDIAQVYKGELQMNIDCVNCDSKTKKTEKSFCLSLPLQQEKPRNDVLLNYTIDDLYFSLKQKSFVFDNNAYLNDLSLTDSSHKLLYLSTSDKIVTLSDNKDEKLVRIMQEGAEMRNREAAFILIDNLSFKPYYYIGLSFTTTKKSYNSIIDLKTKLCRMRVILVEDESESIDNGLVEGWAVKKEILLYMLKIIKEEFDSADIVLALNNKSKYTQRLATSKVLGIKETLTEPIEPEKPKKYKYIIKEDDNKSEKIDEEALNEAWKKYKEEMIEYKSLLKEREESFKISESLMVLPQKYHFILNYLNRNEKCSNCGKKGKHRCTLLNSSLIKLNKQGLLECDLEFIKDSVIPGIIKEKINEPDLNQRPITSNKPELTIESCMDAFFDKQVIEKSCEKCDSKQGLMYYSMLNYPQILIIHFKRFITVYEKNKLKQKKNEDYIDFNEEIDVFGIKYKLKGIINHRGTLNQGHYTSFAFNQKTDEWLFFDDEDVTVEKNFNSIKSKENYVLFFEKLTEEDDK